jgi:hypothetical protein
MVRGAMLLSVVFLAATAATPTQCVRQPSQAYPVSASGDVTYTTRVGDTPYRLAERFYGHGYMEYRIRQANPLAPMDKGAYPAGIQLVIPPHMTGRPVDITRFDERPRQR